MHARAMCMMKFNGVWDHISGVVKELLSDEDKSYSKVLFVTGKAQIPKRCRDVIPRR